MLAVFLITTTILNISHIAKINKELDEISEEQSHQNEDIRNLMIAHMTLVNVLKEAAELSNADLLIKKHSYNNVKGEA